MYVCVLPFMRHNTWSSKIGEETPYIMFFLESVLFINRILANLKNNNNDKCKIHCEINFENNELMSTTKFHATNQ